MDWNRKTKIVFTSRKSARRASFRSFWFFAGGVIICGGLVYGVFRFFHLEKFHIRTIDVRGVRSISKKDVEGIITTYKNEDEWVFLPRWNYFLFSGRDVAGRIVALTSKIKTVAVEKKFPDAVSITIEERMPWGIVCGGMPAGQTASSSPESAGADICAYIDEAGFAFERSPKLFGSLTKKIFIGNDEFTIGKIGVEAEYIRLYDDFRAQFSSLSLPVVAMSYEKESPRDVRIYIGGWYAMVNRDSRPADIVKVLKPLLDNELVGKVSRLEYIDLRFGNKVFYRLKK